MADVLFAVAWVLFRIQRILVHGGGLDGFDTSTVALVHQLEGWEARLRELTDFLPFL